MTGEAEEGMGVGFASGPAQGESVQPGSADERLADRWDRVWSHRERLLKVARRRSTNAEDAEDAVHEAMIRAVERGNVDDDRLGAWLTSVTIRLCIDRFRQAGREADVHTRSVLAGLRQATVEETVCDQAEAKWLAGRSADLPSRQEEVLALRAQGLDLAQIAQRTGLGYQAARSVLARARKTLRAALATTLAVAACLWRGRPRAAGGGAQTATLVSAAMTVTIAGLGLTAPAEAEAKDAPGARLRPYDTPLSGRPSRTPNDHRASKPYAPAASDLPTAPGFGLVSPSDERASAPVSGAELEPSTPPRGVPSALPRPDLPAVPMTVPVLPEPAAVPEPALPTAPHASAMIPPVPPFEPTDSTAPDGALAQPAHVLLMTGTAPLPQP